MSEVRLRIPIAPDLLINPGPRSDPPTVCRQSGLIYLYIRPFDCAGDHVSPGYAPFTKINEKNHNRAPFKSPLFFAFNLRHMFFRSS